MSNFSPKLEDATDEQLKNMVNELDFRVVPLASDELTRRTIRSLKSTIKSFNEKTSKQTDKMIKLTWVIVGLTVVLVIGLFIQIRLANIQTIPALLEKQKNEERAWISCKNNPDSTWPKLEGGEFKCSEVLEMLKDKFK